MPEGSYGGKGWNSTGSPRASTMATPYMEPRMRDGLEIGVVVIVFFFFWITTSLIMTSPASLFAFWLGLPPG